MDRSEPPRHRPTVSLGLHDAGAVRVTGLIGWAVIFGAFMVWEGLGLTVGHQWPTLSHMLRTVTRPLPGRLVLFGLWLWVGWHLFIRGWNFFLRGPLPEPPAPARGGGLTFGQMWQQAIVPLTGSYALFIAMLAVSARRPLPSPRDAAGEAVELGRVAWGRIVLGIVLTVAGGYLLFVAMIGAYVAASGNGSGGLLGHAIKGGAVLAFGIVAPGFVALSGAAGLKRRLRQSAGNSP